MENFKMDRAGIFKQIDYAFDELGITADLTGSDYMREIIFSVCVEKYGRKDSFVKIVYPDIAEKFNTNAANVERCIRTAISKSWERSSDEDKRNNLCKWAARSKSAFSNKEFILILAENISRKCNAMNQEKDKINEDSEQE